MKLYAQGSANGWNEYLTAMTNAKNINALARMRYALQAGMDDLTKLKMNDEKMSVFYIRLLKSVENTAKIIIRELHPMPNDVPAMYLNKKIPTFGIGQKPAWVEKALNAKRKRDRELELFFTNSSF
jgi:hypothetical protein